MLDTYHADDQAICVTDDKNLCDGKGVDSCCKSMNSRYAKRREAKRIYIYIYMWYRHRNRQWVFVKVCRALIVYILILILG